MRNKDLYSTHIPYDLMKPPKGMPTGLGFIFVNKIYFTKIALARPARLHEDETHFILTVSAKLPPRCKLYLYLNGRKFSFYNSTKDIEQAAEVVNGELTEDHPYFKVPIVQLGCAELKQDMLACGFSSDKFSELKPYLG
jgi:hypothetical protein